LTKHHQENIRFQSRLSHAVITSCTSWGGLRCTPEVLPPQEWPKGARQEEIAALSAAGGNKGYAQGEERHRGAAVRCLTATSIRLKKMI
jgi:hypothetical protein